MKVKMIDTNPAYEAVGRVVRGLTYPLIANDYDLTFRELNALATISHINDSIRVEPKDGTLDTVAAMMMNVGAGEAFNNHSEYVTVFESLKEKGFIDIEVILAASVFKLPRLKTDKSPQLDGMLATLTVAGERLIISLAFNLTKTLNILDRADVRECLAEDYSEEPELS